MGFWSYAIIGISFLGGAVALVIGAFIVVGLYFEYQQSQGKNPFQ